MSDSGNVSQAPVDYLLKVDNPMVVPVGKKVRIITTANDVIHAFMVPALVSSKTRFPALFVTPGSVRRRLATTTVSVLSCAARSTPTCPSM